MEKSRKAKAEEEQLEQDALETYYAVRMGRRSGEWCELGITTLFGYSWSTLRGGQSVVFCHKL